MSINTSKNLALIFRGQSNMAGFGGTISDIPTSGLYNQYRFTNHNAMTLTAEGQSRWTRARSDNASTGNIGYFTELLASSIVKWGPEHSCIHDICTYLDTQSYSNNVYVLKHAKGGTSLSPSDPNQSWSSSVYNLNWTSYLRFQLFHQRMRDLNEDYEYVFFWCQGEADNNAWSTELVNGTALADTEYVQEMIAMQEFWKKKTGVYPRTILIPLGKSSPSRIDFNNQVWDYLVSLNIGYELPFTRDFSLDLSDDWYNQLEAEDDSGTLIASSHTTICTDSVHYSVEARVCIGRIIANHIITS